MRAVLLLGLCLAACGKPVQEEAESPAEDAAPSLTDVERAQRRDEDSELSSRLTAEVLSGAVFKVERDPQDRQVVMISRYHDEAAWSSRGPAERARARASLWAGAYGYGFRTCRSGSPARAVWSAGARPCAQGSSGMDRERISRVYYQSYLAESRTRGSGETAVRESRFKIVEECRLLKAGAESLDWASLSLGLGAPLPGEVLAQAKNGVLCRAVKGGWSKWHAETARRLERSSGGSRSP